MRKIILSAGLLYSALTFGQAGAPASPYYNGFNFNQTGTALKTALAAKITSTHTNQLSYQEAENSIKIIDLDPADPTNQNVLLIYGFSNNLCPASASDGDDHRRRNKNLDGAGNSCEWNREHTYAKSLGTPDLGTSGPGADAHHLRASDVDRNGNRGSEKFAAGSGNSHDVTSSSWYPGDEWKGDIARMMMYMYLRYGNRCLPKNVGIGTTVASDPNMIDLFLQWNAEDPVSAVEDQRNTYLGNSSNTYGQGNRNPFIDNPYLATLIWGGVPAENRWPALAVNNPDFNASVSVYPNPSTDGKINIYAAATLDVIEIFSVNGQRIRTIAAPIAQDDIYSINNIPSGFYFLRLTAQGETAIKKVIVN
ncbi:MAG TPA: endonuclease [Flavobacterium sp.]|jgi:endonuclease I